jgi:peptide/nickel transport system substrate-binding protein
MATPVTMTLWYNVNHYGDADLATEVQRELDASGLFKVQLRTAEWSTYQTDATSGDYQAYLYGWFPDYPDADDYTTPFLPCRDNIFSDHFCSARIDQLIKDQVAAIDPSRRDAVLESIQRLTAQAAPLVPLWESEQIAAVRSGVTGVQSTLDQSYSLRMWLLGKS